VTGKVRLPQYANTKQNIVELFFEKTRQHHTILAVRGTTYAFDREGKLDLPDQADAITAVLARPSIRENIIDLQNLIQSRKWVSDHSWAPPQNLISELEKDLSAELKPRAKRLPTLRPDTGTE
jgi:hypothetical protein